MARTQDSLEIHHKNLSTYTTVNLVPELKNWGDRCDKIIEMKDNLAKIIADVRKYKEKLASNPKDSDTLKSQLCTKENNLSSQKVCRCSSIIFSKKSNISSSGEGRLIGVIREIY